MNLADFGLATALADVVGVVVVGWVGAGLGSGDRVGVGDGVGVGVGVGVGIELKCIVAFVKSSFSSLIVILFHSLCDPA